MTSDDFREQCIEMVNRLLAHLLFVDPKGKVAHGVSDPSGSLSCRVLH